MTDDPWYWPYTDNDQRTTAAKVASDAAKPYSTKLDIVTGYFATSAWGLVGDALEELDAVRLLLGKDHELARRTTAADESDIGHLVREALRDDSQPPRLPVPADAALVERFVDFLQRDSTEVKAWKGDGFLHAKAYLFDMCAGVGSANFTASGLQHNRELVSWRQDADKVKELQDWFDGYWTHPDCEDYKAELIEVLRATPFGGAEYSPYQVLIRTLAERYGFTEPPSLREASFRLRWFQTDAVFRLIKLLSSPSRGALLADAVGMGKTFMALGVIHHFLHEQRSSVRGRPVTLIIPASLRPAWEAELDRYQLRWAVEIEHMQKLRDGVDLDRLAGADLVVIDEAHRLRGRGMWFQQVMELLRRSPGDPRVLLLTATPVNTGIEDLTTLLRVLTKNRRNAWAPDIPDFERHLKRVEKGDGSDAYAVLDRSVVRRSRSDILRAYDEQRAAGQSVEPVKLPERRLAHADYAYVADGGSEHVFATFAQTIASLRLAPYDLDRYRSIDEDEVDPDEPPASPLAGLYLSGLLKRFESSLRAVRISLRRLDLLLDRFAQALDEDPPRLLSLEDQPHLRRLVDAEARDDDDESSLAAEWDEALESMDTFVDAEQFDLRAVKAALLADRADIATLLAALPEEASDGKIAALVDLLTRSTRGTRVGLRGRRTLVFTQFRDTAEYVAQRLAEAGIADVALLHGGSTSQERQRVAATFDPGGAGALQAAEAHLDVPQILVSTDVLAEGHNLQLAEAVVNFDLHWNPQVAVQRSGRVDRLNSPHDLVHLVSFLPEEGLDRHLGLAERLNQRFALYKHLGLADEPVTKLAAERAEGVSLEQLRRLYGDDATVLDEIEQSFTLGSTDYMRVPLDAFLRVAAEEDLRHIPRGVQSIRVAPSSWEHGPGVFLSLAHGGDESPETFWRFYPWSDEGWGPPVIDDVTLFRAIHARQNERRGGLPASMISTGPGLLDWDLLRDCASDIAAELTKRRATAAITRGASERSATLRARLIAAIGDLEEPPEDLEHLLDRLEEVRVEDYDTHPEWRRFRERIVAVERLDDLVSRASALEVIGEQGLRIFGSPEPVEPDDEPEAVDADSLRLVSWEWLVEPPVRSAPEQPKLPVA